MDIYNSKAHPIIKNQDTYFLDKKIVTFHSEDRDICKWPNSNEFEVSLPESLHNIQSMRLISIKLDDTLPVFSNNYRNTKLSFSLASNPDNILTIDIDEGTYTPELLASTIENLMNLKAIGNDFICSYNKVSKKILFGAKTEFFLNFDKYHNYKSICYNDYNFRNNNDNWGLPYLLGYERKKYSSTKAANDIKLNYDSTNIIISTNNYYINTENILPIKINGENSIYMEVDKYNIIDELLPDASCNKKSQLSVNNGKVNSAFAQIPLKESVYEQIYECKNNYNPPIKDISKLKFKFRFHDGRLVDFKNINFSFMIEFNSLTNEQRRNTFIRSGSML